MICAEVGHDTLKGKRTAPAGYPGTFTERPKPFSGLPVFLLNHVNFTERAVPTNFFYRCGQFFPPTGEPPRLSQPGFPPTL
jgi:hypothetical protein